MSGSSASLEAPLGVPFPALGILERALAIAFLAGVCFSFVKVAPGIGSDTQPTALLFGLMLLACTRTVNFPWPIAFLLLTALAGLPLLLLDGVSLVAVRNWSNYVSAFVVAAVSWKLVRADRALVGRGIYAAVWTWFTVGAIQTFVSRQFLTFLLADARTSESRGVVALAPEPAMYGQVCLLLMFAALMVLDGRRRTIAITVAVVQLVLFSRSSMAVLILLLWAGGNVIRDLGARGGLRVAIPAALVAFASLQLLVAGAIPGLQGSRLQTIARLALQDPRLLVSADESGAVRAASIIYAVAGFFSSWTIPYGFEAWDAFTPTISYRFAFIPVVPGGYRPMSGYGSALFELGFISVLVLVAVTGAFRQWFGSAWLRHWPTILTFHALLFTSVPLATPLVGLILGVACAHLAGPKYSELGGKP